MDTNSPVQSGQPVPPAGTQQNYAWVAYLFGWITGLIIFLTTKDRAAKFHAAQSIILFGGLHIFWWVLSGLLYSTFIFGSGFGPGLGAFFGFGVIMQLLQIAVFVLWIFLMVKAYQGEQYKLPFIGDKAEKLANK